MNLEVSIFAGMADAMGDRDSITVELRDDTFVTAEQLQAHIKETFPEIAALTERSRVVVNESYVADDHIIHSTDRLALIPPVSGG